LRQNEKSILGSVFFAACNAQESESETSEVVTEPTTGETVEVQTDTEVTTDPM
jgi:predicted RNA methylase